ncbi:unnamed protein product, partial [Closterium sp. NIES-54]
MANPMPSPSPLPPPIDTSSIDKLQLAADKSAINWYSFVGSIRRVLNDAWIPPYRVLDVVLRRPHALPPTEPDHPSKTPPLPPPPGDPPLEPELQTAADQATTDADFIMRRRAYLIRKAEYDAAADAYAQAVAGRNAHLAVIAKYNDDMTTFTPKFIAWSAADNRACTVILGALPDSLMRRFQARELRASVIWAELHAMFERRDISSVGILFQEYFSITLATCDGAVDYVGRMREVADRLEARQAGLSEPLQIHCLLFNLTPDYESRLHAFTEANPMANITSGEAGAREAAVKEAAAQATMVPLLGMSTAPPVRAVPQETADPTLALSLPAPMSVATVPGQGHPAVKPTIPLTLASRLSMMPGMHGAMLAHLPAGVPSPRVPPLLTSKPTLLISPPTFASLLPPRRSSIFSNSIFCSNRNSSSSCSSSNHSSSSSCSSSNHRSSSS